MPDRADRSLLALKEPGSIVVAAQSWEDDAHLSAREIFDLGREHVDIRLALKPSDGNPSRLVVREMSGEACATWTATIIDPVSGMHFRNVTYKSPRNLSSTRPLGHCSHVKEPICGFRNPGTNSRAGAHEAKDPRAARYFAVQPTNRK